MIAVSYIMKRKIKKIFFEVISNSKNFNIIFFNKIVNDQDFPKLTGGLDKGGGELDNVEYGNIVWFYFFYCSYKIIFYLPKSLFKIFWFISYKIKILKRAITLL